MITFKTLTPKTATAIGDMNPTIGILYYIVEGVTTTGTSLMPNNGYYYFLDENNQPKVVYKTKDTVFTQAQLEEIEEQLPIFESNKHYFSVQKQRLKELFFLDILINNRFGTTKKDWEVVEPIIEEEPVIE